MNNDYECPRCHNRFPKSNQFLHDMRCTENNVMPLDKSRQIELNPQKNNHEENEENGHEDNKNEENKHEENKEKPNVNINKQNPRIKEIRLKKREESPQKEDIEDKFEDKEDEFPQKEDSEDKEDELPNQESNYFPRPQPPRQENNYFPRPQPPHQENNNFPRPQPPRQENNNFPRPQPPQNLEDSAKFPEIFTCDICGETLKLDEKEDHMLCHRIQNEEENNLNNNENDINLMASRRTIEQQKEIERQIKRNNQDLQASRRTIEEQKEIERQIKRENEMRRQQNQRDRERNQNRNPIREQNRNQNNNRNNYNMLSESDMEFFSSGFPGMPVNPMRPHTTQNNNRGHNQRVIIRTGPNGTIIRQFGGNSNDDEFDMMNNMMPPMMGGFFNSPFQNRGQRVNIPFEMFSNRNSINELLQQLLQGRNRDHPTDQHILNELPETQIDDVNKLDPEKRNCVICLEDFKNGDKATVLPCIHLFHSTCVQNWLKTQNCCPICKFKLTGENLNTQP